MYMYMNHLEQSTVALNDELKYNEWTERNIKEMKNERETKKNSKKSKL